MAKDAHAGLISLLEFKLLFSVKELQPPTSKAFQCCAMYIKGDSDKGGVA